MTETYKAYGAVRQLYKIRQWPRGMYQILLEGPAGTGKTRGLLEWVHWLCDEFPGIRVLFLRRTKESLAESVLDTWEEHVLWPGHPCMTGHAQRNQRQHYTFPNGSHIVLGGLKDKAQAEKTFSTQYDVVVFFEAREIPDLGMWQWLSRANRNWVLPWQIRIADTNPGAEFHWLNQFFPSASEGGAFRRLPKEYRKDPPFTIKCDDMHVTVISKPRDMKVDEDGHLTIPCPQCGKKSRGAVMFRLLSKFQDNPVYWDHEKKAYTPEGLEYVEGSLALNTGARLANLYKGVWTSEEGVIYEDWDPTIHVDEDPPEEFDWYLGAFDKGLRHPGCLQIWGIIEDSMWLIREWYRTEQDIDWWAQRALEAHNEFTLGALVCDPSEPEGITTFNRMMGDARGRDGEWIARRASNAILNGISLMRWGLNHRVGGGPRMKVVRGYLQGRDKVRASKLKPTCFEEEIRSYIWMQAEDGKRHQEKPDPTCADHSMDCARYASAFMFSRDMSPPPAEHVYADWSFGDMLGHAELMEPS